MFTKLANYLQRVEVINFQITIDARNALQEILARRKLHSHWISRAVTDPILAKNYKQVGIRHIIINVLINNQVNKKYFSSEQCTVCFTE